MPDLLLEFEPRLGAEGASLGGAQGGSVHGVSQDVEEVVEELIPSSLHVGDVRVNLREFLHPEHRFHPVMSGWKEF